MVARVGRGGGGDVGERSDEGSGDCSFQVEVVGTPDCSQKAGPRTLYRGGH